MNEGLRWRLALSLVVFLAAVAYVLPSIPAVKSSPMGRFLPDNRISLGLDLMGGIHLTLGVDVDKAVENSLSQMGQDIRSSAREKDIFILRPRILPGDRVEFVLAKAAQRDQLGEMLAKQFPQLAVGAPVEIDGGQLRYVATLKKEQRTHIEDMALDQAVKTIRNRIDQFGVAEPDIRKQQDHRIQVQLPGLADPARAIQIIGKTAHLEFRIVRDDVDPEKLAKGLVPPGVDVLPMMRRGGDGSAGEVPVALDKEILLTGENVADARPGFDQFNQAYVMLTFNSRGAAIFERVTGENVRKRLAIVLDGKVYSAPSIQEKIAGGRASITGHFTTEEAQDLAIVLRAGSLPAPVNVLEERTVGPSLGQESIDSGILAGQVGGAAVVVFTILYYGASGAIAVGMLCFTILLILAGMAGFGATLTLPGLAGIALTIGMGVDANVLIYERIREELRRGLTPLAAIHAGFDRAMLSIIDSNLTTVIAAAILYQFGTGPVRGFAVTLTLGILASMFTAIFVSRAVFDLWMRLSPSKRLSI